MFVCLGIFWSTLTVISGLSIRYIHVNPDSGHNTVDCYSSNSSKVACLSLDWALKNQSDGTRYVLSGGTHLLNSSVAVFENLSDMALIGEIFPPNNSVIRCTKKDIGFAFHNVHRFSWFNLSVINCSSWRISTSKNFHTFAKNGTYDTYSFLVALYFNNCANITFDGLLVESTPNGTGLVMYNTFGKNTIVNSNFINNTAVNPHPGGGGVYIEFTYCVPGDKNCYEYSNTTVSYFSNNTDSQYFFHNCMFSHNKANSSDSGSANSTYIVPYRADHVAFGRGGGLSIFMNGNASNNTVIISNCIFANNSALWGGGLFIEFHDDTFQNKVMISDSKFLNNFCYFGNESGTAGGGMRLGHYVYGDKRNPIKGRGNHVSIGYCCFKGNAALDGGGLSISPTVEDVQPTQVATVNIFDSNFTNNYGRLGAALHIDRFVMILEGFMLNVYIKNCKFHHNSIEYTKYIQTHFRETYHAFQTGAGAVYMNQVPVSFISQVNFCQNIGSAIAAVSTSVNFTSCRAQFSHNKGNNGGAIALLGAAYLIVNQNSSLTFMNNKAIQFGGAIYNSYIERQNLISYTNCFIRYADHFKRPEDWTAKFYFHNNTDNGLERNRYSAIYTTSILPCSRAGGSGISKGNKDIFCWNTYWDYTPGDCSQQIFSDVGEINFHSDDNESNPDFLVEAFPGHQFTLPISIIDDLGNHVGKETVFSASVNGSNSISTYVWNKNVTLPGLENKTIPLELHTVGERVWEVNMNVSLQTCPPGFKYQDGACVCAGHYIRAVDCDNEKFKANISENSWIGLIPGNDTYLVAFCPPYYCASEPTLLPNKSIDIDKVLCSSNRVNIMCGECKEDFGVAINSPSYECVNCTGNLSGNIVEYIASVYIPLIVLFSAIILFNIRLTSGPANAFILYSQVIAGLFDLDADGQISISTTIGNTTAKILDDAYRVVYGVFNLQFVERFIPPLCVGKLNTLDVLLANYAVALSPLAMIIMVLVVFKLKECCSVTRCCVSRRRRITTREKKRTIASAILPAFSAFLLLSYTKFSTISSFILRSNPFYDETGKPVGTHRVYYAGQYSTDDAHYTKYRVTAYVVFCTFVAIPPLLLLDFPRRIFEWAISKCDCLWQRYPADKVQILLDTFQGCYRNKMRFFAGLYFLFRLVINVTCVYTHEWFDQYLVQQVACCVMVALLSICQPYNDNYKIFNTVDVLIFTNLGVINALSTFLLSQSGPLQPTIPLLPLIIQYILLYLPLIYMIIYLLWLLISFKKQYLIKLSLKILRKLESSKYRSLQVFVANIMTDNTQDEKTDNIVISEDEALLERAQQRNMYRPLTQTEVRIGNVDRGTASVRDIS